MIDTEPLRLRLDPEIEPDFRSSLLDSVADLPTEQELAALRLSLVAQVGEPERLRREPNSSLGASLTRLNAELPSAAELRELRARLPRASLRSRARRRALPRAALAAAWLLPFAAAAAAAGYFLRDQPKPTPAPSPSHEPMLRPLLPSAEPAPSASSVPTLAPSSSPHLDVSASAQAPLSPRASELELMHDAKAALASDPGHALSLLNRLAKLYPSGVLAQEREVLAIDALLRLGRKSEANARATRFSSSYPASAHWPHIQRLLSNAGL
jgi:hypothetical protein